MLRMVSHPHRPQSGHITCYLNRTYHVLPTKRTFILVFLLESEHNPPNCGVGCSVLPNVDYSVTVPVPVDVAFRAFQDLERLLNRGIYEEAVWTDGAPWEVSSRLRYVLVRPVRATISAVVTAISPPRSIDLINHGLGVIAEQHVSFGPDLKGGTRIRMTMSLVGQATGLSEKDLQQAAIFITHDALDTVAAYCQQRRASAAPGT